MPIYLDNAASTPLDPEVFAVMASWLTDQVGNASSVQHAAGRAVATAVAHAREQVAALLHCTADEVVFTSCATEACNLAITGMLKPKLDRGEAVHIIAPLHEHPAVLEPVRQLARIGAAVTWVEPGASGVIDASHIEPHLRPETAMVACMAVNNETGTINDVATVRSVCRAHDVSLLVDASQAPGRLAMDVFDSDLTVVSSHKMHGPQGAAALAIRGQLTRAMIAPVLHGGGHEGGLRSGTLNGPAIVGMGEAAARAMATLPSEAPRQASLRDRLEHALLEIFPGSVVHGDTDQRVCGISMMSLATGSPGPVSQLVHAVALSHGSACSSVGGSRSHVLEAMGCAPHVAASAVRLSLGRLTSEDDVAAAIDAFAAISPRAD